MEHHSNPLPGQVKHERGKAAINREGEASLGAPYGALNTARPLEVTLKYFKNIPAIRGIQQISRPGNRTYINVKRILKYSVEGTKKQKHSLKTTFKRLAKYHSVSLYQVTKTIYY